MLQTRLPTGTPTPHGRRAPRLPLSSLRGPHGPPCFCPERPPARGGPLTPRSPRGLLASHQQCRGRGATQHTPPPPNADRGELRHRVPGPSRQERRERKGRGGLRGVRPVWRAPCVPRPLTAWETGAPPQRVRAACSHYRDVAHARCTRSLSARSLNVDKHKLRSQSEASLSLVPSSLAGWGD